MLSTVQTMSKLNRIRSTTVLDLIRCSGKFLFHGSAFEGKFCLITGGTKGIGKATVEAFANEKAQVFTCSRTQKELDQVLEEWKSKGYNNIQGRVCDVSKADDIKAMVDQIDNSSGGKLHALVNNAAIMIRRKALDAKDEEFDTVMGVNVKGAFNLSKLCHPLLKAAGSSSVILMGSFAAINSATVSGPMHGMAKASMSQLTKNLACEWALDGIRVNCIAPGIVKTPMAAEILANETFYKNLMSRVPMKRAADPSEIADVIVFLSSTKASFVTGQMLPVDGGYSICGLGY